MTETKSEEEQVQELLDRIQVILNSNEYLGPYHKMGAIKACTDTGYKIILEDGPGESHATKD